MGSWLTEIEVLAAARRHGAVVSSHQLKRWRDAALIPRPVQSHLAGRQGSVSSYPPGTLAQVLKVAALRRTHKKLERIRFELWWDDSYTGPVHEIQKLLIEQLHCALAPLREHRDRYQDPFDAAEALVTGDGFDPQDRVLRTLRRLAGGDENLRSVAHVIFEELFGGIPVWDGATAGPEEDGGDSEPTLRELVERAIGVALAKAESLSGDAPLLSPGVDIVEAIRAINRHVFDLDHPAGAIRRATDEELEQARQTARLLVDGLRAVVAVAEQQHGRDVAGLSVLRGFTRPELMMRALAIQFTLALPSLTTTSDERTNLTAAIGALSDHRTGLRCGELFLNEHPGYGFLLKSDATECVRSLPEEEQRLIEQAVKKFLLRHPECAGTSAESGKM